MCPSCLLLAVHTHSWIQLTRADRLSHVEEGIRDEEIVSVHGEAHWEADLENLTQLYDSVLG